MKYHLSNLLPGVMLLVASCDNYSSLERQIAVLEATVKKDQAAIKLHEKNIATLGGVNMADKFIQQSVELDKKTAALELDNTLRDRKWTAIEVEFAKLKPAAEAYKAIHLR